jgi:hypothetical protein
MKYEGETGVEAVNQIIDSQQNYNAEGCVMSLMDRFSDEAEKLADNHDILLMDGKND